MVKKWINYKQIIKVFTYTFALLLYPLIHLHAHLLAHLFFLLGVFVLSDNKFRWLDRYANDDVSSKQIAAKMLHFPCGILRGALANLGLSVIVNADFTTLPGCTFNIRVLSNMGSK